MTASPPPSTTTRRPKSTLTRIALITAAVLAGLALVAFVVMFVFRDSILNQIVKPKLEQGVAASNEGNELKLGDLHYRIWESSVVCDSGHMSLRDSATRILYDLHISGIKYSFWGNVMECNSVTYTASDSSTACTIDSVFIYGFAPRRLIAGDGFAAMLLAQMRFRLCGMVMRQPSSHTSLECARMWILPAESQLSAEDLTESDSSRECSMGSVSLRGVDWRKLFGPHPLIPTLCGTSVMDANKIVILYPGSQYEFMCSKAHISFPDSTMTADTVTIMPVDGDAVFFADSKFRKTRIRFDAPRSSMHGADLCGLLTGTIYAGRLVQFHDATIEILTNKDKPANTRAPAPRMPHEIIAQQKIPIRFDSVKMNNGTVLYQERFVGGAPPAKLRIDNIDVAVTGFGNNHHPPDTATVDFHAKLQDAAVHARVVLPLVGGGLSARFSGSMKRSDLSTLNSWLEIEDGMRVKSGKIHDASFDMRVAGGRSTGSIRAVYSDLFIAKINEKTKSDGGFFNRILSFVANTFKLRSNNLPDKTGKVKLGIISYVHKRDEPFFQFMWFSLRSGLKDLVGF